MFNNTINQCDLYDLGFNGYKYTWANNQANQSHIQERLDRFYANSNWISLFPRYINRHKLRYTSDHAPIMLEFYDFEESRPTFQTQRIKRFEQVWTEDQECKHIISSSWDTTQGQIPLKLNKVLTRLDSWGKVKFGDLSQKVKNSHDILLHLKNHVPDEECLQRIKIEEKALDELLAKEEMWWSQRAKVHWLKFGDSNTKYFHYKANQRRRKNTIHSITDSQGQRWRDVHHIHQTFKAYFKDIFTSSKPVINTEDLHMISSRIDQEMKQILEDDFTNTEVISATYQLKGSSAPGPDGLSALFYHKYWSIIGNDILDYTLLVLNKGHNPAQLNYTFLSLIPKVTNPSTPSEFRPISLCNVIMKIITKTVANKIKIILPKIINETQSAFLPGRLITDNSLVVFETIHYLKKAKKKRTMGLLALS